MRWPFVSRERYDAVLASAVAREADVARLHDRLLDLMRENVPRSTYDGLLEKYHALKVVGAAPVEPHRVMVERPANPIMDAVSLAGGNDMERRAFLGSWATQQRLAGTNEDDIVHQLLNWKSVDEDDEPQADRMRS